MPGENTNTRTRNCDECGQFYSATSEGATAELCTRCNRSEECGWCGDMVPHAEIHRRNDGSLVICAWCDDEEGVTCENCGDRLHRDDSSVCERCDEFFCQHCYDEHSHDEDEDSDEDEDDEFSSGDRETVSLSSSRVRVRSDTFEKTFGDTRFFGLECEVTDYKSRDLRDITSKLGVGVTCDGSVNNKGTEIQTRPMQGDTGIQTLKLLCDGMKRANTRVDKSCGLHIHMDMTDMTRNDLIKAYVLYYQNQRWIFSMLPASRRDNQFCVPIEPGQLRTIVNDGPEFFLYGEKGVVEITDEILAQKESQMARKKQEKSNNYRYCFVNGHAYFYLNTLEVRAHSGTIEFEKMEQWVLMNLRMVATAKSMTLDEIKLKRWTKEEFLKLFEAGTRKYIEGRWAKFGMHVQMPTIGQALDGTASNMADQMKMFY